MATKTYNSIQILSKELNNLKQFLLNRNFELCKWQSENLFFAEIAKKLNNDIKIEFTITNNENLEYHSHTFALSIDNCYSEIAIESIEEFKQLVTILDK